MLTCIACSKQLNTTGSLREPPEDGENAATPSTKQAIKALTAQVNTNFPVFLLPSRLFWLSRMAYVFFYEHILCIWKFPGKQIELF